MDLRLILKADMKIMKSPDFVLLLFTILLSCKKEETNETSPLYFPPDDPDTWEQVTPASLGWNTTEIPSLFELLENNGTRAFIVLKDGKITIEEYFGNNLAGTSPFSKNTLWYWASAGKTLTAFVVGKAKEDGYLNINDKSSEYLGTGWTSLTAQQESKITIRHQLTMTTGLDDGVSNSHSIQKEDLVYKAESGSRWAYHNGPYTLLEKVVSEATGKNFDSYFNLVLRDKTGMDGTWQWIDDDHVFFSTPRSMARFGLLILNNGKWAGQDIISDVSYVNSMITPSQAINKSYGFLWWLNGKESFMIPESQIVFPGSITPAGPADMFSGMGKNGQYISIVPSMNIVMIRMGEDPTSVPVPFLFLDDIWEMLSVIIK